jgi:hypothetical protein
MPSCCSSHSSQRKVSHAFHDTFCICSQEVRIAHDVNCFRDENRNNSTIIILGFKSFSTMKQFESAKFNSHRLLYHVVIFSFAHIIISQCPFSRVLEPENERSHSIASPPNIAFSPIRNTLAMHLASVYPLSFIRGRFAERQFFHCALCWCDPLRKELIQYPCASSRAAVF